MATKRLSRRGVVVLQFQLLLCSSLGSHHLLIVTYSPILASALGQMMFSPRVSLNTPWIVLNTLVATVLPLISSTECEPLQHQILLQQQF